MRPQIVFAVLLVIAGAAANCSSYSEKDCTYCNKCTWMYCDAKPTSAGCNKKGVCVDGTTLPADWSDKITCSDTCDYLYWSSSCFNPNHMVSLSGSFKWYKKGEVSGNGWKIAVGIIVPLVVIGLVGAAIFVYFRRKKSYTPI